MNSLSSLLGGNYPRWCNTSATALMKQSDATLDPTDRIKLLDQAWNAMATTDFVMLPIYNLPNITIWRADKIAGPVGQANSSPYSGFINADEWYLKGGATSS